MRWPQATSYLAGPLQACKIVFSDGTGPKQTLYYFSTNLADGSFERSGFSAFLAKLGPADSLIKSASYLLHKPQFSGVRKLLLDRSATIVQDDSGIPLDVFWKAVAAAGFWPLCWAHLDVRRLLPAPNGRTVSRR
jgi:hypothetical protein